MKPDSEVDGESAERVSVRSVSPVVMVLDPLEDAAAGSHVQSLVSSLESLCVHTGGRGGGGDGCLPAASAMRVRAALACARVVTIFLPSRKKISRTAARQSGMRGARGAAWARV